MNVRNSVHLIGRIPRSDKFKISFSAGNDNQRAFYASAIAVQRTFKKPTDEYYPEDIIQFSAFGKQAEYLNNYCHRGDLIAIEGELRKDEPYTDQNGQQRPGLLKVYADSVANLTPKDANQTQQTTQTNSAPAVTPQSTPQNIPQSTQRPPIPPGILKNLPKNPAGSTPPAQPVGGNPPITGGGLSDADSSRSAIKDGPIPF